MFVFAYTVSSGVRRRRRGVRSRAKDTREKKKGSGRRKKKKRRQTGSFKGYFTRVCVAKNGRVQQCRVAVVSGHQSTAAARSTCCASRAAVSAAARRVNTLERPHSSRANGRGDFIIQNNNFARRQRRRRRPRVLINDPRGLTSRARTPACTST